MNLALAPLDEIEACLISGHSLVTEDPELLVAPPRPRTRGECAAGPRPCPWVGCTHHLLPTLRTAGIGRGYLRIAVLDDDSVVDLLAAMPHTCTLDLADEGGRTLEAIGVVLGCSREAVHQAEVRALAKLGLAMADAPLPIAAPAAVAAPRRRPPRRARRPARENPLTVALRRAERWTLRARRDGEASDRGAACDLYQAARLSAGLIPARPLGLCAARHDHNDERAW